MKTQRYLLLDNVPSSAMCECGHTAEAHRPDLPSSCAHGHDDAAVTAAAQKAVTDGGCPYRAMAEATLPDGCHCIGFKPPVDRQAPHA